MILIQVRLNTAPVHGAEFGTTSWTSAGTLYASRYDGGHSTEAWHRIMAVNATGVFFGIKHAIPAMIANGGGSIVNLSSIAGIIGSEQVHMAYNASKAAVRLMTKSVAVQHAKDKIRCNSVHPGIMPPMRTSGPTAEPAIRAERMRAIPMRRPGEVDEVAYAILFLASLRFEGPLRPVLSLERLV